VADYADQPEVLQGLLASAGMDLVSVYTGGNFIYADILGEELTRVERAAQLAESFGASSLVVGGGARRSTGTREDDYTRLAEALEAVADIAESHGLSACYHPHLSTIVESPEELDKLFSRTSIGFCPDTAHLAAGGGDPAELIRRYPERVHHVHLKDVRLPDVEFLPLGQGDIDFDDVLAALLEVGYDDWLIVELDSYDGEPRAAAAASKSFLDHLLTRSNLTATPTHEGETR
jgi:inosose dehydratase